MALSEDIIVLQKCLEGAEQLARGGFPYPEVVEWKIQADQTVAKVPGSADLLMEFLKLDFDGSRDIEKEMEAATGILRRVLQLAEGEGAEVAEEKDEPALKLPKSPAFAPPKSPSQSGLSSLSEALNIVHSSAASLEEKEEAEETLRALRRELDKSNPQWSEVRQLITCIAGFSKELFFAVLPWLLEDPESIS